MTAVLTIAPISGTSIKPEVRRRVYWTNVSTNTKVGIGNMGKSGGGCLSFADTITLMLPSFLSVGKACPERSRRAWRHGLNGCFSYLAE